jgi:DNA-binding NarL/FixJ family response regulator
MQRPTVRMTRRTRGADSEAESMTEPISVLIVDDHPLFRSGVASLLGGQPDMRVVGEASDGLEAVALFRQHRPHVTLMDLQMPHMDGVEAMEAIRTEFPGARIVVLTTYKGDAQALRALKAGASGYLLKSLLHKELVETIRAVVAGRRVIPPEIAAEIAGHAADEVLTEREIEVLRSVARGNSNKRVAEELSITEETVKAHLRQILAKLAANDRTHAVTIAIKRGIIRL